MLVTHQTRRCPLGVRNQAPFGPSMMLLTRPADCSGPLFRHPAASNVQFTPPTSGFPTPKSWARAPSRQPTALGGSRGGVHR